MYKIKNGCPGCGACATACPVGAISIKGVSAEIGSNCIGCGVCTYACPVKLIVDAGSENGANQVEAPAAANGEEVDSNGGNPGL